MSGPLRVVAILSAYNEADILETAIGHLAAQGVDTYVIDDGSTDGTAEIAERLRGRGVIGVERRPPGDASEFSWTSILRRKEALAAELDADWFMHHDADEFRETPWPGMTLRDGIAHVSALGYNAIDFAVLNFRPVDDRFQPGMDPASAFEYYEPAAEYDAVQIKCWQRQPGPVDLAGSAGHEARFAGRLVCPVRFLARHYPIRSSSHGARKVFVERRPRFDPEERALGWHEQYEAFKPDHRFLWDPGALRRYDEGTVKGELARALEIRHERVFAEELARALADSEASRAAETRALARVEALQRELEEMRSRAELERRESAALLRARATEVGHLSAQLDAIRASKSWRITAPLRAIYGLGRGPAAVPPGRETPPSAVPISSRWGLDRGLPVDRYYIHTFLDAHRQDIRGRVLEVKDPGYTKIFGGDRVVESHVLDVRRDNREATVVADLSQPGSIGAGQFDCFILTQTLHIIWDVRAALAQAMEVLAPGGVLLFTIPAVSRVSDEDGGLVSGDYWRMTQAAVRQLCAEVLPPEQVRIVTYGNVRVSAAFLYGMAAEELTPDELAFVDPWFPLIHCVRAVKL